MKNLTSPRRVFLAALAAVALIGCKPSENSSSDGGGGNAGGDIIVGEFASLTGTEAAFGQSSHKGTQLAFEQVNAAGGVLGRKFKHLVEDTQSKAGESATIARKFVSRDKVVAVLGEVASGRSLEAAPVCQQFGVPMISPSSTNPKVTEIGDFIFRVCFIDPFQGKLISEFVTKTLKTKKVAILSDVSSAYSVGLAQYFKESFTASGGQVVIEQKYSNKDKDFKAQLTAIKAAGVDGILVPGYYNEVGLIVKQARELGVMVPMFGGDGWEAQELIQIAGGEALQNTYYSTHFSPANKAPEAQSFVDAFKARYNGETPDAMAALGYDSARALVEAIKKAGTTEGKKLKDALAAIDFVGATGRTKLDAKRDAAKPAVIITTEGGKFKFLQSIEP